MQTDSNYDEPQQSENDWSSDNTKGGGDVISKGGDQSTKKDSSGSTNDDSARTPINTDQI